MCIKFASSQVFRLAAMLLLVVSPSLPARAGSTAIQSLAGGSPNIPGADSTIGFEFSISQSISVTDLGLLDVASYPLHAARTVGLWDSTGTLLSSVSVSVPGTPPSSDTFIYGSITPTLLTPGTYTVGMASLALDFNRDNPTVTYNPAITFLATKYTASSTLEFPTTTFKNSKFVGPNFEFDLVAAADVPELDASAYPSAIAALAMGLAILDGRRRKRSAA